MIPLGDPTTSVQFTGPKRRQIVRQDSFHYIPLLATLESLLQDNSFREEIRNYEIRKDDHLEDFFMMDQFTNRTSSLQQNLRPL